MKKTPMRSLRARYDTQSPFTKFKEFLRPVTAPVKEALGLVFFLACVVALASSLTYTVLVVGDTLVSKGEVVSYYSTGEWVRVTHADGAVYYSRQPEEANKWIDLDGNSVINPEAAAEAKSRNVMEARGLEAAGF